MDKVRLSSGHLMPVLGLGTWQAASEVVSGAVLSALNTGYRHIDTAYNYRNEEAIGSAIEQWLKVGGNSREDLFVTTKLPHIGNRSRDVEKYLNKSLERLKLSYVDLYLVHMPFTFVPDETGDGPEKDDTGAVLLEESDHLAVWREMEKQVLNGKTRSIGLSNFNSAQIERICKADSTTILPSCLQIEMHAALQQKFLAQFCKERNIVITAYSPLGSPGAKQHFHDKYKVRINPPDVLHSAIVSNLAKKHQRTPAQILLRHLVQLGAVVIPKSVNTARIAENSKIFDFELTNEDMEEMGKLDAGTEGRILNFLFFKGVENHPEYPFPEELRR